ncbi:hypothetical protein, partial [Vibrio sp. FF145]|uniref:hypothetical protein n=1 Tax=Vibrio sp. FF145 TaxID=3230013 RepID=UPI00352FA005
ESPPRSGLVQQLLDRKILHLNVEFFYLVSYAINCTKFSSSITVTYDVRIEIQQANIETFYLV